MFLSPKTLKKLMHSMSSCKLHASNKWQLPIYSHNRQFAPPDTTEILDTIGLTHLQGVVGSFHHYVRAIENTIITVLNEIVNIQSCPT